MGETRKYPEQTGTKNEWNEEKDTTSSNDTKEEGIPSTDNNETTTPSDTVINPTTSEEVVDVVITNGMEFKVNKLDIGLNHIQFTLKDLTIYNALDTFKNVDSISLSKSNASEPYGTYSNLNFSSAIVSADDTVTVTMLVLSDTEVKLKENEKVQSNIEDIVSRLIYGEDITSNGSSVDLVTKVAKNRMSKGESFDNIIKDYPKMSDHDKDYVREGCSGKR